MKQQYIVRECKHHGMTEFKLQNRGGYRCKACMVDAVVKWRRKLKFRLIDEFGGKCFVCAYDRCPGALEFHHIDPAKKSFAISDSGISRAYEEARKEACKCVLLCCRCHREVECGFRTLENAVEREYQPIPQIEKSKEPRLPRYKTIWPEIDKLLNMVENSSYVQVGRQLGVSDNAVRKRIKTRLI
jgi:hypothetical protein